MEDDVQSIEVPQDGGSVAVQTPELTSPVPTSETATPEPAAAPSLADQLATLDPKEFKRLVNQHPGLAGVVGRMVHETVEQRKAREFAEQESNRRRETESELLKFSKENADYIKEHYPKAYEHLMTLETKRASEELDGIRGKTVNELATSIGKAMHDIPEWKELGPDDHETLARELIGKPDEQVLPLFNRLAVEMVVKRRVEKEKTAWRDKELAKEREVIRSEEAAKLLRGSEAPDPTRPKGLPGKVDISGMSDEDFEKYWNNKHR